MSCKVAYSRNVAITEHTPPVSISNNIRNATIEQPPLESDRCNADLARRFGELVFHP